MKLASWRSLWRVWFLLWVLLLASSSIAQVPRAGVCEITRKPVLYSGRVLSVRAYVIVDYHGVFLADPRCKKTLPLILPEGSGRPDELPLRADEAYKQFDAVLQEYGPGGARSRGKLEATFEGRFDYVFQLKDGKRVRVVDGFGPTRTMRWQFVLNRVSNVAPK